MTLFDRIVLLLTGLIAIVAIGGLVKRMKGGKACPCIICYIVSFFVLLVAGLLLIAFGWDALANNFVAVVACLIPFCMATGLMMRFHRPVGMAYLGVMVLGVALIAASRYGMLAGGRLMYPIFHGMAGLTIVAAPLFAVKAGKITGKFAMVSLGGCIIGLGGVALAFLTAGKQLLFFSQEVVLLILAPVLFLTALFFTLGLLTGEKPKA